MGVTRRQAMVGVGGGLAILAAPARERFTAMAIEPVPPSTPDSFADYIKTEGDRWATIVIKSGAEAG